MRDRGRPTGQGVEPGRRRLSVPGRRWSAAIASLVLLALVAALPADLSGQTVQGRVVDDATDRSISGAVVRLVDDSGDTLAVALTDSAGTYRITGAAPGRLRLRADRIGYRTAEAGPFEVDGDTAQVDLRMEPSPVPIPGVEVSTDQANRKIRQFLGVSPGQLRVGPIRRPQIERHAARGSDLSGLLEFTAIANMQVLRSRDGPCYRFRGRGCLPVFLDGARLNPRGVPRIPLEMLNTVVVVLPNEVVAYPEGAVHLLSTGFMR